MHVFQNELHIFQTNVILKAKSRKNKAHRTQPFMSVTKMQMTQICYCFLDI